MKYILRVYSNKDLTFTSWGWTKVLNTKKVYESEVDIDDPTIGNIRTFFENKFGFSISDYGLKDIELTIEGVSILGSCDYNDYKDSVNVINIYLRKEDYNKWITYNREQNINNIIKNKI